MGLLIDQDVVDGMQVVFVKVQEEGGEVFFGGGMIDGLGYYVELMLVCVKVSMLIICEEIFVLIFYVMEFDSFDDVIEQYNLVLQGFFLVIFMDSVKVVEQFFLVVGSDCGIVNVNIGILGVEIGGVFGGEKDIGGGCEVGFDVWKFYMWCQICMINYGDELLLVQGVEFDV